MAMDEDGHARCGRLIDHPKFETWKEEMAPGEMWSVFGEKWVAETGGRLVTLRFAVVYEATADFQTATELADRVFVESIDWLEEDLLDHQRTWIREWSGVTTDLEANQAHRALRWIQSARVSTTSEPAKPDARAAHRAILYLRYAIPELAGILLIRDQDDQTERREGLEQARRKDARLPSGGRRVGRGRARELGDQRVRPE